MLKILLTSFLLFASLSAQTLSISANSSVYATDVSIRGNAIFNMFSYLMNNVNFNNKPISSGSNFAVALQTTTGFLQPIRSIDSATNSTILIVNYGGTASSFASQTTVVLPVEQIVDLVYTDNADTFSSTTTFPVGTPANTVPYFSINTAQRAADIQSAFNILNSKSGRYSQYPNSSFDIQTTLTTGLISNVQNITISGNTFLLVYSPKFTNSGTYVVVEPDQISSIAYSRTAL